MMDEENVVGKRAYITRGFFAYLDGIVQLSDSGITKYKIVFENGGSIGANFVDLVILDI